MIFMCAIESANAKYVTGEELVPSLPKTLEAIYATVMKVGRASTAKFTSVQTIRTSVPWVVCTKTRVNQPILAQTQFGTRTTVTQNVQLRTNARLVQVDTLENFVT